MSSRDRRHVLVALLGMLAGILVAGGLLVLGDAGATVDGLAGPALALLVALVVLRVSPRRTPRSDTDS